MTTITLIQSGGEKEYIKDPDFVDTLCNTNEVAIDGETYSDVIQVRFEATTTEKA